MAQFPIVIAVAYVLGVAARIEGRDRVVVATTATYEDEVQELLDGGVDFAFDLYSEAGQGFAAFECEALASQETS